MTGWQMTSAAEMPGSRILGPSSGATIINPASDRAHQPARGATTPLPQLWRPWSNSNSVLLTIFSCSFVSYFYLHVPRFCHRLVLRTCLPGLCLPLQIATSHYTHPDKLQTSYVLYILAKFQSHDGSVVSEIVFLIRCRSFKFLLFLLLGPIQNRTAVL